jgi:hypothetical protein
MKNINQRFFSKTCRYLLSASFLLFLFISCEKVDNKTGSISLRFSSSYYSRTKSVADVPDTTDFLLKITAQDGTVLYNGKYGDVPENIIVASGTYMVSVKSSEFKTPQFDKPQFGDEQCVVVPPDGIGRVVLNCSQINSGVKLRIAANFLTSYPKGVIFIKSDDGKIIYAYKEKRIAYFNPGDIVVILDDNGVQKTLFARNLKPKEILSVGISVPKGSKSSNPIFMVVDTARVWLSDKYVIGSGQNNNGSDKKNAFNVPEAKGAVGLTGKWVCGYIVGNYKSANKLIFKSPFPSYTNIVIAGRRNVSDKRSCIAVELRKQNLRTVLNLVNHPDNIGRKIYVKGDIVSNYFGSVGIKNVVEYKLE